jgi:hypothetical protein
MKSLINDIIELNYLYIKENEKLAKILDSTTSPRISNSFGKSFVNPEKVIETKSTIAN